MTESSLNTGQAKASDEADAVADGLRRATDAQRAPTPLVERYVAVTLNEVPVAQRDTAEPALRAAIEDEINHRHDRLLGDENITRADIEIDVLEEMGDPEAVAAAMTLRPKSLIGPRFYHDFKYILWWTVALIAPVAGALAAVSASNEGADSITLMVHSAAVALTAVLYAAAWITLGFVISERVARRRAEVTAAEWTVDRLPEPTRTVISVSQTATVVAAALIAATAIVVQELEPALLTQSGVPITFLNPEHWPWIWGAIVALLGVDALAAIGRHVRGTWTMRAAAVNLVLLSATYGLTVWLLIDQSFLNDEFFEEVGWPTDELPTAELESWAVIALGALWLIGVTIGFVRAWRARLR